jgi:hypothetical protein
MMNLKEMVKDNKKVRFAFYRDRQLWYETECGFQFPISIEEAEGATFLAEDKALLFQRYIRSHIKMIEQAKREQAL